MGMSHIIDKKKMTATSKQEAATVQMVMSGWLEERMREKEEWRFATMEYGEQCVTMAGIKWTQVLCANS